MYRIILVLAGVCMALMTLSVGLGLHLWWALDRAAGLGTPRDVELFGAHFSRHFVSGLFTTILVLATHSLVLIYLIGVGKAIKEAAGSLPGRGTYYGKHVRRFHARCSPALTVAMLVMVAAAVMGMDSYKGYLGGSSRRWIHLALILTAVPVNLWAFKVEYGTLRACSGVLDELDEELEKVGTTEKVPW